MFCRLNCSQGLSVVFSCFYVRRFFLYWFSIDNWWIICLMMCKFATPDRWCFISTFFWTQNIGWLKIQLCWIIIRCGVPYLSFAKSNSLVVRSMPSDEAVKMITAGLPAHQLTVLPHQLAALPHQLTVLPHQLTALPHQLVWVPPPVLQKVALHLICY